MAGIKDWEIYKKITSSELYKRIAAIFTAGALMLPTATLAQDMQKRNQHEEETSVTVGDYRNRFIEMEEAIAKAQKASMENSKLPDKIKKVVNEDGSYVINDYNGQINLDYNGSVYANYCYVNRIF